MTNKNIQEADQAAQITPAVAQQRVKKGLTILTGVPADVVVVSPQEKPKKFQTENKSLVEKVVGLVQRRKKAVALRRRMPKMELKRRIARTRLASNPKLMQRAMRMAKQQLRKRIAGARGANYQNLSTSQKIAIDKMVEKRAKSIKVMATRMMPRVKQGEMRRLKAVQSGKSTKGVYGNIPLNQEHIPLYSNVLGENISKEELNQLFSLYEGKFGQAVKSIVTSPVRAVGLMGKVAVGTTAAALAAPSLGTPAGAKAAGAAVLAGIGSVSNKLSNVGAQNKSKTNVKPVPAPKKTIVSHKEWDYETYLREKAELSLQKKAEKYRVSFDEVMEVFNKGLEEYTESSNTPHQFAMQRVNSYLANLPFLDLDEGKRGLWANIHAKRARIKAGSGERMRKPGSEGAPTKQNFIDAAEETVTEVNQMTLARYASKVREKLATGKVSPDKEDKRRAGMKHAQMKLKTGQYNEATEKKTPAEKFKAGLKKAGYDPDAGAKRLLDLIAKQKKEREEFEKKYKSAYEEVNLEESFVVDRAAGYSTTYTAADLGIKIKGGFELHPSVTEEGGAGDIGTDKLTNKYKKDTPGQALETFMRQMRAKRKASTPC